MRTGASGPNPATRSQTEYEMRSYIVVSRGTQTDAELHIGEQRNTKTDAELHIGEQRNTQTHAEQRCTIVLAQQRLEK